MESLKSLQKIVTKDANDQAFEIYNMIVQAGVQQKDSVMFSGREMHPLVLSTLVSRGYRVTDVTGVFGLPTCKQYKIHM